MSLHQIRELFRIAAEVMAVAMAVFARYLPVIRKKSVGIGLAIAAVVGAALFLGGSIRAHPAPCGATPLFAVQGTAAVAPMTVVAGRDDLVLRVEVNGHCRTAQEVRVAVALSNGRTLTWLHSADPVQIVRRGTNHLVVSFAVPATTSPGTYVLDHRLFAGPKADQGHLAYWRGSSSTLRVTVRGSSTPTPRAPTPTPRPSPKPNQQPVFACTIEGGTIRIGAQARLACDLPTSAAARQQQMTAHLALLDATGVQHDLGTPSFRASGGPMRLRLRTGTIPITAAVGDGGQFSVAIRINGRMVVEWQGSARVVASVKEVGPSCPAMRSFADRLRQAFGSYWTRLSGHRLDVCTERGVPGGVNFIGDIIALISPADEIRDLHTLRSQCRSRHPEDDCDELAILLTAGAIVPIPAAKGVQVASKMAPMLRWSDDVGRVIKVYASRGQWRQLMQPFHLSADRLWRHRFAPGMAELVHRLGSRSAIDASMAHATLDLISRLPAGQSVVAIGTHAGRAVPGFTVKHSGGALTHVRTVSGDHLASLSSSAMARLIRESARISTRTTLVATAGGVRSMKVVGANIVFPYRVGNGGYAAIQRFQKAAQREGVVLEIPGVATTQLR